ncbi:MAG: TolC family protein [Candidatus Omnitrophica bacterium]|nr:TolC family protein [Candidatus Omnitrophota bacterium]
MRRARGAIAFFIFFISSLPLCSRADEAISWQECVKEAAKNHPDLIAAEESIKQSEAVKKITASALYPQITADISASTVKNSGGVSSDTYSYGISGSQLVFDGIKTIDKLKAAGEDIKAAKQSFRFTSSEIRLRLRTAFINLLNAQELVNITQQICDIRRGNLELVALRYASGLEHRGALLTAEADLANAEYQLAQAKRRLVTSQRKLIKEMGRKEFAPITVKGDFQVKEDTLKEQDFEAIANRHPSLHQIIAQQNSAAFSLKAAYANFLPVLSGSAGVNKTGKHWNSADEQWNAGLTLSLPIFEGGLRAAQISQAEALLNQLKAKERSARDVIILNLQQTYANLQDALENVRVQYKVLVASEERSKIAQAQYSIGLLSYDNWTIIEDNLVSAKISYLNAQTGALLAEANWIQAKGETLEYD